MKKVLSLCFVAVVLLSCGLKKSIAVYDTYPVTPGRLDVFQASQQLPENRIMVGTISVGEKGATKTKDCTYEACMEAIQEEAKKMGGHFIHVIDIKAPSVWGSSCYNITTEIYRYK